MVYEWEKYEHLCYQMYIDEKKSLQEIMDSMRVHHNFAPSKRAYQMQFSRWGFPSKQNPAHKNDRLVARIKELWEKNLSQREMLRVLNDEDGFDITQRELMRVRSRNRWLLRTPNPEKGSPVPAIMTTVDTNVDPQLDMGVQLDDDEEAAPHDDKGIRDTERTLSPQVIAKRRDRLQKLEVESAERWETRKRRRRTRGWAGLPADPPGPPRFPSETTIDESKAILSLSNDMYRDLRTRFARICDEDGVSKKTIAGPEKWEGAKNRLIQEVPHMQNVVWADKDIADDKKLALDVICTDVTKRMRTMSRKMTIAEAKNILGINPEETRTIRHEFSVVLKADHFTSKSEAGRAHWDELKRRWLEASEILQRILATGETDPGYEDKLRATDVLARDVMKRLRDDQTRRDPNRHRSHVTEEDDMEEVPEQPDEVGTNHGHGDQLSPYATRTGTELIPPDRINVINIGMDGGVNNSINEGTSGVINGGIDGDISGIIGIESGINDLNKHSGHSSQSSFQHQPHSSAHGHQQTLQDSLIPGQALTHSPAHGQTLQNRLPNNQAHGLLDNGQSVDPQLDHLPVLMSDAIPMNAQHAQAHATYLSQAALQPQAVLQGQNQQQHYSFPPPAAQASIPAYIRPNPTSSQQISRGLPLAWIVLLTHRTFEELRQLAIKDLPGAVCGRIDGILSENGASTTIAIDKDYELDAYLFAVNQSGVAASFFVEILGISNY